MARNVIISLLGSAPYCLPYQEDLDHLVTEMERHWERNCPKCFAASRI